MSKQQPCPAPPLSFNFEDSTVLLERAYQTQQPWEAVILCDRILETDPRHLPALELKSKSLWRQGEFEAALTTIKFAAQLNPFDPGYHFLIGDCLENLRRNGEALEAFERCRASTDKRIAAEAEGRISQLEQVQQQIVAELIQGDREFSRAYQRDAAKTLSQYGFCFSEEPPNEALIEQLPRPTLWARPS